MSNTYLVISHYLQDKRINDYFQKKGWKKLDKEKKNPTFFYLDYLNIYNKKYYSYQSFIKNLSGNDKHFLTNKANLSFFIDDRYLMKTYNCDLKNNLDIYKNIFENEKVFILKPIKGREGIGIRIVENFEEMREYFRETILKINFKKVKETDKWVIQEYIQNPYLYKNRKFHFRVYFLIVGKKIFYFNKFLIITAILEYKNLNYMNEKIHDSHYNEKSIRNKIYPEDFTEDYELIETIDLQIKDIFENIKKNIKLPFQSYPEDKNSYEVFAADIMLTNDKQLKVLELNHSIGYPESIDKRYPIFENQLDIVLQYYNLITEENTFQEKYFVEI